MKSLHKLIEGKYLIFLLIVQSLISIVVLLCVLKNYDILPNSRSVANKTDTNQTVVKNNDILPNSRSEVNRTDINTTVVKNLNNTRISPRILCAVTTQLSNDKKIEAVKRTWGQRCDYLYFISSTTDPSLPSFGVKCEVNDHSHLWCKNRQGIMYGVDHYGHQFDWFLKTDDDTYVIIENLKNMLSYYDPNKPIWFGCQFALGGDRDMTYMSGGAGYAISRKAVIELSKEFHKKDKCYDMEEGETGADDVIVGRCLKRLGVELGDSRDKLQRNRFFPFASGDFVNPTYNVSAGLDWFAKYNVFPNQMGFNCCSDTTISFHYVSPSDMYVYDFFVYHMTVSNKTSIQ